MVFKNTKNRQEEFEDTKGVIRIRKSKENRQHNDQKKKDKRTNKDQKPGVVPVYYHAQYYILWSIPCQTIYKQVIFS
jgi:hypothetical protein